MLSVQSDLPVQLAVWGTTCLRSDGSARPQNQTRHCMMVMVVVLMMMIMLMMIMMMMMMTMMAKMHGCAAPVGEGHSLLQGHCLHATQRSSSCCTCSETTVWVSAGKLLNTRMTVFDTSTLLCLQNWCWAMEEACSQALMSEAQTSKAAQPSKAGQIPPLRV